MEPQTSLQGESRTTRIRGVSSSHRVLPSCSRTAGMIAGISWSGGMRLFGCGRDTLQPPLSRDAPDGLPFVLRYSVRSSQASCTFLKKSSAGGSITVP